ncbi:HTH transcriptional regulator, MarR family [Magnetospira sp. QH-2]|nr:HTH transcriptional regulator, MarR family [Magnetospira sp. QH-2]
MENNDFATEAELRRTMELLFFAYRDFTGEADAILDEIGFGRAHHRALYFIGAHPGSTVSDLLDILKITKQSLARVLSQLVREDYVRQEPGPTDRRQRLLYLTDQGQTLERRLAEAQWARILRAYGDTGEEAVSGFRAVLRQLIEETDRPRVDGPRAPG